MQCLWLRLLWNYRSYINTNMLVVASRRLLTILHLTFDWCFGFDLLHSRKCRPLLHIYHIYVLLTVAYAENFQGWVHSVAYGGHFFDVHCLWRHNMTSYSCLQTNVLAKFVGIIRIFVYTSGLQRGRNCPHGAISCVVGAILWFTRFGGRFRFPGGDFCRLKHTQMLNWFQKYIYLLLWNQSIWCTFDSMVRNKGYKTHIGLVTHRGVTRGGRVAQFPGRQITMGAPNHCGAAPKSPKNIASTFFNAVNLLPKELRFKYGGAKLASCPGRHLTSLRPRSRINQTTVTWFCETLHCTNYPLRLWLVGSQALRSSRRL